MKLAAPLAFPLGGDAAATASSGFYFINWFGETNGYLEDWFDSEPIVIVPSANPGGSVARILGTLAPRPQVPPWRHIEGAAGVMLTEVRRYMSDLNDRAVTFGNHVQVTFTAPGTSVRVDSGLGGPAQGYKVVRANGDVRVFDGNPPTGADPTPERGILWLTSAFDVATLPAGVTSATVDLYIY